MMCVRYSIFILKEKKAAKNFNECHVFTVLGNWYIFYVLGIQIQI
jgi:hypothetical protein